MEGNSLQPVKHSLEQFLAQRNLSVKVGHKLEQLLEHPSIRSWLAEHPDWSTASFLPFLNKVRQYVQEKENCQHCSGLASCTNMLKGHYSSLITYGKMLELAYTPCTFLEQEVELNKRRSLIKSHHIPKEIVQGSFHQFDKEEGGRMDAFNAVLEFCLKVQPGRNPIGLYLYGPLGVGKSYLLGAACNELAKRNIASLMVYSPDFFREMKEAIGDQTVHEKLQALKEVPVLILDDLGAENLSPWARDEVLGAILQYRIMEKLPTLYTSNYNYEQLEEHLAYSQRGGVEQLKAKRILERIRHYTDAYFVSGKNRRVRA